MKNFIPEAKVTQSSTLSHTAHGHSGFGVTAGRRHQKARGQVPNASAKKPSEHRNGLRLTGFPPTEQWGRKRRRRLQPPAPRSAAPALQTREGEEPRNRKRKQAAGAGGRMPPGAGRGDGAAGALAALLLLLLLRPRCGPPRHLHGDGAAEPRATGSRLPGTERAPPCVCFLVAPSGPGSGLGQGTSESRHSWWSSGPQLSDGFGVSDKFASQPLPPFPMCQLSLAWADQKI